MPKGKLTRRTLLKQASKTAAVAAAVPYIITSTALGKGDTPPASDRIAMGFIGVGGHGIGRNLNMFLQQADAQPVALCDVDPRQLDKATKRVQRKFGAKHKCFTTADWRKVIARQDVDAVMISTPDHWHVLMSVAAIKAGKDVICEKPTYSIGQGRILADTVKRYKAVFQTSTEDRSMACYHRMAELVRNGRIGKLQRIRVQLPAGPGRAGDPRPKPIPQGFDWDMWLGPAPKEPYRNGLAHFHWRWKRSYSGGQLTDWGSHQIDIAQWANNSERTGPISVEGTGKKHSGGLYDTYHKYNLKYVYDTGVEMLVDSGGTGLRFEGSDGWIGNDKFGGTLKASSKKILASKIGPEELHLFTCPKGEHRNFLDCMKTRNDPYFPAEVGHRCSSISHIGNIAMDLGKTLKWDPKKETFPEEPNANRMLITPMRKPWSL
ncbi:MAG: Gfo/Idh/MocA family oxidoreductase [Phycisphaerales bacterium]|jgi:myo-inositol 2-dehydrogenase / D-chiro-inositol 1-dehydrogenase|nr:Gfo/Idh/MocA family oxidoreductase [Phycisphaerales bacterium]